MSLQLPGFLNQAAAAKRGGEAPDRRCPCQPGRRADARIGFQRTRDAMSARVSARPTPLQEQWHDPRFARFPRAERRFSSERPQRSAIHANTAQNCPFLSLGTVHVAGPQLRTETVPLPVEQQHQRSTALGRIYVLCAASGETPTRFASACQCRGCGRRLPARMSAAYGSETPSAADMAGIVTVPRRG